MYNKKTIRKMPAEAKKLADNCNALELVLKRLKKYLKDNYLTYQKPSSILKDIAGMSQQEIGEIWTTGALDQKVYSGCPDYGRNPDLPEPDEDLFESDDTP
jgi:hypothetical protein